MAELRLINTAPRDGMLVLLAVDGELFDQPFYWSKKHKKWLTDILAPAGVRRGYLDAEPTHWAPLLPTPAP